MVTNKPVHHLTQYFIRDSRWAEEIQTPASTRRTHTMYECLICHALMSTQRKFSDRTTAQQRQRIADWKVTHSHQLEETWSR